MGKKRQALSVLIVSTLAFTVCFMVWMMFGVIGVPIKKTLNLTNTEFGILTATKAPQHAQCNRESPVSGSVIGIDCDGPPRLENGGFGA